MSRFLITDVELFGIVLGAFGARGGEGTGEGGDGEDGVERGIRVRWLRGTRRLCGGRWKSTCCGVSGRLEGECD